MTTQAVQEPRKDASGLEAGQVVGGKFRLERFVARGGMGSVWAATHLVLAAPVAIKFLDRLRGGDPEEIELRVDRFRFEAQISARLSSQTKHMVAVHDAGMHLGMPYLVMEFAPGKSLQDLLDERGRLSAVSLIPVVEQVGEALDAAHRQGIVHRDVKPGNILFLERRGADATGGVKGTGENGASGGSMTDSGSRSSEVFVKLTDFGVAKPSDGSEIDLVAPKQTAEGLVVGSPAYMSPEQIAGIGLSTGASDRWSLGIVVYEAITGWLPFRGESLTDFAIGITTRQHDPPSSVVDGLAPSIDAFFDRALAKQADQRFPSGVEMARAFKEAVEASAAVDPPAKPAGKGWLWIAGGGSLVAAIAAAWLIAAGSGGEKPAEATPPASGAAAPTSQPTEGRTPGATPPSGGETPAEGATAPASTGAVSDAASTPGKRPKGPNTPKTAAPGTPTPAGPAPPNTSRTPKPLDPSEVH